MSEKLDWTGRLISVQPRIRLTRSFDARHHIYLGYALHIRGRIGDERRRFSVGVGRAAHDKHQFEVGQDITGQAAPVSDPNLEPVEFYKASGLHVVARQESDTEPPPWLSVPPPLEVYRSRGHRRLAARDLRHTLCKLHVGLQNPGYPHHRPVEPHHPAIPFRDVLLRPQILRALPPGANPQGAGPSRHVLGRGGLGRCGGDGASRPRRLAPLHRSVVRASVARPATVHRHAQTRSSARPAWRVSSRVQIAAGGA